MIAPSSANSPPCPVLTTKHITDPRIAAANLHLVLDTYYAGVDLTPFRYKNGQKSVDQMIVSHFMATSSSRDMLVEAIVAEWNSELSPELSTGSFHASEVLRKMKDSYPFGKANVRVDGYRGRYVFSKIKQRHQPLHGEDVDAVVAS
eukprot:Lithocolla_globosa_v1_NODE_271_length_4729_cov_185.133291.p4 type:complete len:147 gc:universal NODE_271_length_4729_cov_185.133291:1925-1485(-)